MLITLDWRFLLTSIHLHPETRFPASVPREGNKLDEPRADHAGKVMLDDGVIAAAPEKFLEQST